MITCVSQFTADDVAASFPGVESKIKVIHNGLSPNFNPLQENEKVEFRSEYTGGKPYFLYLGAMHPRKNVERIIDAFDRYKSESDDQVCLVLAGRMAWKSKSIGLAIRSSTFRNDIILLEDIDDVIYRLMGSASVLCYVSLFEGFGLPVLEALASGIPVITSEKSAMAEVCKEAAFYVNPHSSREIADKMKMLRKDDKAAGEHIKTGLRIASNFSWERTASSIYECLRQISQ